MGLNRKDLQFIQLCEAGADIFSTCGKRQYMAYLLDENYNVLGTGYNGGPSGTKHCRDGGCPRLQNNSPSGSNYDDCIAVHAEQNAIARCQGKPTTLIVNGPPCFTCAKMVLSTTVKRIVYIRDESYVQWPSIASFLEENGIELLGYKKWQPHE